MNELERVQFALEHVAGIMSLDVAQRQVEMEATIVPEDMDPVENETLEEAMLQSIIEVSLVKAKDEIIEIDNGIAPIRQRPMSDVDEQIIHVAQSDTIDADKLRCLEEIYGVPESISIEVITKTLERRKIMMLIEEPIGLT